MSKIQLPVVVTPSRVELALRCYRRHVLHDIVQRALYFSPSLEFGSVIHAGAAAHWKGENAFVAAQQEWIKRFEMNPQINKGDLSAELVEKMMQHYVNKAILQGPFGLEPGDWQIVTVEERLEVPLATLESVGTKRHKLSFQTDRVVYNKSNGHLVIIDTKTSARMDARWRRQWDMSLQMKLYKAAAVGAYSFEIDSVDVVVEGLLKDVPSKIEYVPCPEWSMAVLQEAVRQASHIADRDYNTISSYGMLLRPEEVMERAVNHTSVNYSDCYSYGVQCPFYQICSAEPDERLAILKSEYFEILEADSGY